MFYIDTISELQSYFDSINSDCTISMYEFCCCCCCCICACVRWIAMKFMWSSCYSLANCKELLNSYKFNLVHIFKFYFSWGNLPFRYFLSFKIYLHPLYFITLFFVCVALSNSSVEISLSLPIVFTIIVKINWSFKECHTLSSIFDLALKSLKF